MHQRKLGVGEAGTLEENVVSGCFACFGDDTVHEVGMQTKKNLE
jgi:hypothetical protein